MVANNIRRKGKKLWTDRQGGSLIGYYEAPDGENEALFIADRIQKFLREAEAAGGEVRGADHCAVLYRTNSQSRFVEEALRRYNIAYTMVGGFSFYERAEIKDLLGYLRLIRNPHDSMALQRIINTPARGIGKTTLETLERLALETGQSTWDALAAVLQNRLIPTRALLALSLIHIFLFVQIAEKRVDAILQSYGFPERVPTSNCHKCVPPDGFKIGAGT